MPDDKEGEYDSPIMKAENFNFENLSQSSSRRQQRGLERHYDQKEGEENI